MIHTARQKAKFRSFVRKLRNILGLLPIDPETVAIGILERLWHTAATDAYRGDIGKLTDDEIAESCGWFGEASLLVSVLVETRWLDTHPECRLVVHDWADHCPSFVRANAGKYGGFVNPGGSYEEAPIGSSPGEAPQGMLPPNLTKPNLTKPNQLASFGGLAARDFLGSVEGDEVVRQANKLRKAVPSVDADLLWRVVWVGTCSDRAFVGDLMNSIRNQSVKNPSKYITGAARKEAEKFGYTWDELRVLVPPPPKLKQAEGAAKEQSA